MRRGIVDGMQTVTPLRIPRVPPMPDGSAFRDAARERLQRQMLSTVSHDLKTPLASIIGSLEVYGRLKDRLSPEKQRILLDTALREACRLDDFITAIIDKTRIEQGMMQVQREVCELGSIIQQCVLRFGQRWPADDVQIEVLPEPVECVTDPVLLTRAVDLLLEKAATSHGGTPSLRLGCGRDRQENRVFIRLQDQTDHRADAGYALACDIMKLLGGALTAETLPEEDIVFTLSLPLA